MVPDDIGVAAADDVARFRRLYQRWAPAVLAYAARRTPSRADADDVLSDTFVVCWRRLRDVPQGDEALPWLYAVAARALANQRRGANRRLRLAGRLRSERPAAGDDPGEAALAGLDAAMQRLRPDERELLRLSAWDRLGPAQLGAVLGCSANAASIRLHRARRSLREAFTSLDSRPGRKGEA